MKFRVIGAGLAGVEAAWQIANKGYKVSLYEMKPIKKVKHISRISFVNSFAQIPLKLHELKVPPDF